MRHRGILLIVIILLVAASVATVDILKAPAQTGIPSSVGLLYFEKKNHEVGDWVTYEVRGTDYWGKETVDYQRIQIGMELEFRGENCFWLETGFGTDLEHLDYSAVLVSEEIYNDPIPDVRHGMYVRKMHMGEDHEGNPTAMEVRTANPDKPLPDLSYLAPEVKEIGRDTIEVAGKTFNCIVLEEHTEVPKLLDKADSTVRFVTRTKRTRWVDPSLHITGLIKEEEYRERLRHTWPLGKVSTDFPVLVTEAFKINITLLDMGEGAEPNISDRIIDGSAGMIGE